MDGKLEVIDGPVYEQCPGGQDHFPGLTSDVDLVCFAYNAVKQISCLELDSKCSETLRANMVVAGVIDLVRTLSFYIGSYQ